MIPTLPQNDSNSDLRKARLAQARAEYQFDFSYHDIGFVKSVPPQERANLSWRLKFGWIGGKLLLNELLVRALDPNDHYFANRFHRFMHRVASNYSGDVPPIHIPRDPSGEAPQRHLWGPGDYLELFKLISPPRAVTTFALDWYFAWQRVAGVNPVLIERVRDGLPDKLALEDRQYRHVMGDGDSLAAAIGENRLYLVDYEILEGLPSSAPEGGKLRQYLWAPIAVYARPRGSARLAPVAIQLGQRATSKTPVVLPSQGEAWNMAKIAVQVADSNHHGVVMHNVWCHLSLGWITLSTRRSLEASHPLMILLGPHFQGTMNVNLLTKRLIEPGGNTPELQSLSLEGTIELIKREMGRYRWNETAALPQIESRGVASADELPDYPMRDDGLKIWSSTRRFVESYVRLYYGTDGDVASDAEVQQWLVELQAQDGGRLKDIGDAEGRVRTIDDLATLVAQIIYRASAYHAIINYSVFDFMSFPPDMPGAGYAHGPEEGKGYTRADTLRMLPPMDKAMGQLLDVYLVGNLRINRLGHYPWFHFRDARVKPLVERFREELGYVEGDIERLNVDRPAPYPVLLPSKIAASIVV